MSSEPLHIQINNKFLSKIKSAKILDEEVFDKLEKIVNSSSIEEKELEALLCQNEIKKT